MTGRYGDRLVGRKRNNPVDLLWTDLRVL